ncbi:MAG: hypothetical protein E6J62_21095 [Deltaproteobacteria bacterium]|nr:MAG: hypothetical protein E6J62_21095 [Deltaproteobacteria bacterium]
MRLFVGITDGDWYELLAGQPQLEEVNFWQPGGNRLFKSLAPGELFLFKLHSPDDFVVGGGVFAHSSLLPVSLAWERPRHTVQGKGYDVEGEAGAALYRAVQGAIRTAQPPLAAEPESPRYGRPTLVLPHLGQGTFRVLVTDAYQRRCAATGERTLPVLQAAHIQPYAAGGAHRVENGLLLRSDLHTLFDRGYVTVTSDARLEVSRRIREEFENGRDYYALHGRRYRCRLERRIDPRQRSSRGTTRTSSSDRHEFLVAAPYSPSSERTSGHIDNVESIIQKTVDRGAVHLELQHVAGGERRRLSLLRIELPHSRRDKSVRRGRLHHDPEVSGHFPLASTGRRPDRQVRGAIPAGRPRDRVAGHRYGEVHADGGGEDRQRDRRVRTRRKRTHPFVPFDGAGLQIATGGGPHRHVTHDR